MSRRITLSDFEIKQIISGLESLRKSASHIDNYELVKCGWDFYQTIIDKLDPPQQNTKEQKDVK